MEELSVKRRTNVQIRNPPKVAEVDHSDLKLFTGFARAALMAWKLMVSNDITIHNRPDMTNTHHSIPTRYEYPWSHVFIAYQAMGVAMIIDIMTRMRKSFESKVVIFITEAPKTFLIPISFILISAI